MKATRVRAWESIGPNLEPFGFDPATIVEPISTPASRPMATVTVMIGLLAVARVALVGLRSMGRDPNSRGLLTLSLILVAGGALFYRQVEGLSWLDSFYFTVITLTTVGYGDIAPQTAAGKLFTMAYVLIGIGILVALVGEVAGHVIKANAERVKQTSADETV